MALRLRDVVTGGLWLLLAAMLCAGLGCSVKLNDNGSVFCRFGTTIEFGHETSTTNASTEATGNIASEFLRAIGLWKEKGEITDAELLEAIRLLQHGDSVPLAELLNKGADEENSVPMYLGSGPADHGSGG